MVPIPQVIWEKHKDKACENVKLEVINDLVFAFDSETLLCAFLDENKRMSKETKNNLNWCPECECNADECPCPDWHRHEQKNGE